MKIIKFLFLISLFNFIVITTAAILAKNLNPPPSAQSVSPTITPTSNTSSPSPSASVTRKARATPTPQPVVKDTRCIITISGQRYDVTSYQYQHSGGNIFNCGTDMTSVFTGRHSSRYLNFMNQFKI